MALGIKHHVPAEPQPFELWEEHATAFGVFRACRTQWRIVAGMGGAHYQGLDYTAMESVMRMQGIEPSAELLEQIQHIEAGAVGVMNDR